MSGPTQDVMISYRWRRFSTPARALVRFFDELGVRSWLDVRELDQTVDIPRADLEEALTQAIQGSRLLLFFQTEDAMERDMAGEPVTTAFNWQIFERQFAGEILFVYPRAGLSFIASCSGDYIRYYNMPYLAYLVAMAVGRRQLIESYWEKYFGGFPRTTAAVYHVWKFHALPAGVPLPPIIDPERPDVRPNKVMESFLKTRRDIVKENRFVICPSADYSAWFKGDV